MLNVPMRGYTDGWDVLMFYRILFVGSTYKVLMY